MCVPVGFYLKYNLYSLKGYTFTGVCNPECKMIAAWIGKPFKTSEVQLIRDILRAINKSNNIYQLMQAFFPNEAEIYF